nr:MAG TPA: hypothetical protein [Caudoviricetes sp.]
MWGNSDYQPLEVTGQTANLGGQVARDNPTQFIKWCTLTGR